MTDPDSKLAEDLPAKTPVGEKQSATQMAWVDGFTDVLDTRLRLPGTKIRFGLDFILGLVPGAGDLLSLGMSGMLILTMVKNGASPMLAVRMLGNVLLDTIVGAVPLLGNLFDLFYKANTRNLHLMREYYEEDKHRESVWPLLIGILIALILIAVAAIYLIVKIFMYLWSMIGDW